MDKSEMFALGFTCLLIVMDYVSGVGAAIYRGTLKSSKMRGGLWNKLGELGAILLACVVTAEGHYLGIPYQIDLLVPAVLIWINIMEVTSILENLTLLNPDLDDTGFLQIFRRNDRTDDTDDSEDTKHGN